MSFLSSRFVRFLILPIPYTRPMYLRLVFSGDVWVYWLLMVRVSGIGKALHFRLLGKKKNNLLLF